MSKGERWMDGPVIHPSVDSNFFHGLLLTAPIPPKARYQIPNLMAHGTVEPPAIERGGSVRLSYCRTNAFVILLTPVAIEIDI